MDVKSISNLAYRENCGNHNRTIFAVWNRDQAYIGAGCFFGPLHEFCEAVDDEYSGDAAERYKADAQDCVKRLVELMQAAYTPNCRAPAHSQ